MTGNTKVWRAPLAGLASLAMLATMGVAAGTANAAVFAPADVTVTVDDDNSATPATVSVTKGDTLADALKGTALDVADQSAAGVYFVGWYDVNNTNAPFDFYKPLTGDVKIKPVYKANADKLTVTFSGATFTNVTGESSADTIRVDKTTDPEVPATRLPIATDAAVTSWDVTDDDGTVAVSGKDLAANGYTYKVVPNQAVTFTATGTDSNSKVTFKDPSSVDSNLVTVGAASDGEPNNPDYTAFVADDAAEVKVPSVVYKAGAQYTKVYNAWRNTATGKVFKSGTVLKASDVVKGGEFVLDTTSASTVNQYTVTFDLNGGNGEIDNQVIDQDGTVSKPADPTREGWVFQGWKSGDKALDTADGFYAFDSQVKKDLTLTAQWAKTADVKVTFSAGNFDGAGDDVTITVAGDAFVDASKAPKYTREGYTYSKWGVDFDGNGTPDQEFDFDTDLAATVNKGKSFILVPYWSRVDENAAKDALTYVQTGIQSRDVLGDKAVVVSKDDKDNTVYGAPVNDGAFFTAASWSEFETVYKAQYQKYVAAKYVDGGEQTNEVDSKTSAEIVNALKDAWQKLQFKHNGGSDPAGVDATVKGYVHRLYSPSTGEHFYSGNSTEIQQLTSTTNTVGGWQDEGVLFGSVPTGKFVKEELGKVDATPIEQSYVRFYNPLNGDHVWTLDGGEEYENLSKAADWNKEGVAYYTPTFTGTTDVVRLYNAKAARHLLSTSKSEQNTLAKGDWTVEGLSAKAI